MEYITVVVSGIAEESGRLADFNDRADQFTF